MTWLRYNLKLPKDVLSVWKDDVDAIGNDWDEVLGVIDDMLQDPTGEKTGENEARPDATGLTTT